MSDSIAVSAEYRELLDSIKQTIAAGRFRAARAVNNVLVETYWEIGQDILTRHHHPLAVTEWRRLPSAVRRALPTTEALTETVTRTVREIESIA